MHQQPLARVGQAHAAPGAVQQGLAAGLFQPLHLHAQRRLRAAHALGGCAQRASLGHGGKAAQQVDVEGSQGHGQGSGISSVDFRLENYSFY